MRVDRDSVIQTTQFAWVVWTLNTGTVCKQTYVDQTLDYVNMPNVRTKVWNIVKDIWSLKPVLLPVLVTLLPLPMVTNSESKVSSGSQVLVLYSFDNFHLLISKATFPFNIYYQKTSKPPAKYCIDSKATFPFDLHNQETYKTKNYTYAFHN